MRLCAFARNISCAAVGGITFCSQRRKDAKRAKFEINVNVMDENEISAIIVDCCYRIHCKLGPGLLESVYENVLCFELQQSDDFQGPKQENTIRLSNTNWSYPT